MNIEKLSRNYKNDPLKPGEKPPYEDLKYLYLDLNWSREEIAEFIGKSDAQTKKYLAAYKLRKTQEQKIELRKRTMLAKYGVENISQLPEIKAKKEQKALDKYGVKNVSQAKEIKAKVKATFQEKYNCNNPMQIQEVKNKVRETNLERYGCESPMQNKEIQEKVWVTTYKRYGARIALRNKLILEKLKQTNLERYGCVNPMQNEEIQAKMKGTNLERYGAEHIFSLDTYKNLIAETNLERYGCVNPMQNEEIQEKVRQTNLKRYNYFRANQSPEFKKEYWGEYTFNIIKDKESLQNYIENQEAKTVAAISSKLNMSESAFRTYCHKYGLWDLLDHYTSSYELELQQLFPHMHKTKSIIAPYEIDLYDEEHKFGIEFNGNYWHSEIKLASNYHQKKSFVAEDAGIFLYHIWEYEWQDPIKKEKIIAQINNILGKNERRIYARDCYVKEIRRETAEVFINEYHMQGYASDSIRFGLYDGVELLAVMTFGKPRFKSECEYELIRYCSKANVSVIGGASKLFKEFIRKFNPQSVLSYSHIDKGTGKLYEKLGFTLKKISNPDYVWCDGEEVLSRYQCQKHKLNKLGFEGSEQEIMDNLGFFRIFGCGNKVWTWTNEDH